MAKKRPKVKEKYAYVRAIVDCGSLRWEYQIEGSAVAGHMNHDEDVSDWSQDDVIRCTRSMLSLDQDEKVEVVYA